MEKLRQIPGSAIPEKRDFLYSDLESKIGVLRRVWTFASGLGIPSTTGTYEADKTIQQQQAA